MEKPLPFWVRLDRGPEMVERFCGSIGAIQSPHGKNSVKYSSHML